MNLESIVTSENISQISEFEESDPSSSSLSPKAQKLLNHLISKSNNIFDLYKLGLIYYNFLKSCDYSKIPLDFSNESEFSINNMNYIYFFCGELKGTFLAKKLSGIFLEIVFNMIATKNPNLDWLENLSMEEENLGMSKEVYFDREGFNVSGDLVQDFYEFQEWIRESFSFNEQLLKINLSEAFLQESFEKSELDKKLFNLPFLMDIYYFLEGLVPHFYYNLNYIVHEGSSIPYIFPLNPLSDSDLKKLPSNIQLNQFVDVQLLTLMKKNSWILKRILPLIDILINNLVLSKEISIHETKTETIRFLLSFLIERLGILYPEFEILIVEKLKVILNEIETQAMHSCQIEAAHLLLSSSITSDQNILSSFPSIKVAFQTLLRQELKYSKNFELKNLYQPNILKVDFYLNAGEDFYQILDVVRKESLIWWSVEGKEYDVEMRVEFLGEFEGGENKAEKCLHNVKLNFQTCQQYQGIVFAKTAGLYKFVLNNKYSWFNSKLISYRIRVLENIVQSSVFKVLNDPNNFIKESFKNIEDQIILYVGKHEFLIRSIKDSKTCDFLFAIDSNQQAIETKIIDIIKNKNFFPENLKFFEKKNLQLKIVNSGFSNKIGKNLCEVFNSEYQMLLERKNFELEQLIMKNTLKINCLQTKKIEQENTLILSNLTISEINESNLALFLIDDHQLNYAKLKIHDNDKTTTFHELFEVTENIDQKFKIIMALIHNFFMINRKIIKKLFINKHRLFEHLSNEEILDRLKEGLDLERTEVKILNDAFKLEDVLKY